MTHFHHKKENEDNETSHIVVVGGGFAGLKCTIDLASVPGIRITLIDRNNYQQFQPLLYQVAASIISPSVAAFALRDILRDRENVDVQMDEVVAIDLNRRSVKTSSGKTHAADYLVLATGSRVNFYGIPGAERYSFPLYSLTDAEKLRSAILQAFEAADREPARVSDGGSLNFVVVGGGPTGVEMAGTLSDMLKRMLHKEFRHLADAPAKVFLVEAAPSVLGTFSTKSQNYAAESLRDRGVQVSLGVAVKEITPDSVLLSDGSRIASKTVIWAAGLKAIAVPTEPAPPKGSSDRIEVQPDLTIRDFAQVYAIGDVANALGEDGMPLAQLAAVAQQAGKHCAENIIASIRGKSSPNRAGRPFVYADRGILAMIGRDAAIAELGKGHHEIIGPVAFVTWLGLHAALLTEPRAKLEAIVEWAWQYYGGEHAGQLIDR